MNNAEIKKLLADITQGKWTTQSYTNDGKNDKRVNTKILGVTGKLIATVWNVGNTCIQGHQYNNQKFIAAAPEIITHLLAQNEKLSKALEFYADPSNYEIELPSPIDIDSADDSAIEHDYGELARKALPPTSTGGE